MFVISRLDNENDILILVAEFEGPDVDKYAISDILLEDLRSQTKGNKDIRVQPLRKTISVKEGNELAQQEGKKRKADFVIWGWYRKTDEAVPINVHFEAVEQASLVEDILKAEQDDVGSIETFSPSMIESFELQTKLSERTTNLTLTILGLSYFNLKDWDKTISLLGDLLDEYRNSNQDLNVSNIIRAYEALILSYAYKRDYHQALIELENLRAISGGDFYHIEGQIELLKGRCDTAINSYQRDIYENSYEKSYFYSHQMIGYIYYLQSDYENANLELSKAISWYEGRYENSFEDLFYLYDLRAYIYSLYGQYDKAFSEIEKLMYHAKNKSSLLYEVYITRAWAYYFKGEYEQSAQDFSVAMNLDSGQVSPYWGRSYAYRMQGKYRQALTDLSTVLKDKEQITPISVAFAYRNRGDVFRMRSIEAFPFWQKQDLNRSVGNYTKAINYLIKGDDDGDKKDKESILWSCHITAEESTLGFAYLHRSSSFRLMEKYDQSISDIETSLSIGKFKEIDEIAYWLIYLDLISTNIESGNFTAEVEYNLEAAYQKISTVDFEGKKLHEVRNFVNAYYYTLQGEIYKRQNKYELAIKSYNDAIENDPRFALPFLRLGEIYLELDKSSELEEVLDLILSTPEYIELDNDGIPLLYRQTHTKELANQLINEIDDQDNLFLAYFRKIWRSLTIFLTD